MSEGGLHPERPGTAGRRTVEGGDGNPVAALAVLVVSLALAAAAIVLFAVGDPEWSENQWYFVVDLADAIVYGVVAWLVLARRTHPVAWILALTAVGGGVAAISFEWSTRVAEHPGTPLLNPLPSAQSWAWVPGTLALMTVVPWLVRDEPLDRTARIAVGLGTALTGSLLLFRVTDPFPWPDGPTIAPFPIRRQWWMDLAESAFKWQMVALVILGLAAAADVARRWRSRSLEERRGLGWLVLGVVPITLSFVPLALPDGVAADLPVAFTPLLHLTSQLFFPAAVLVAVLRQRMWGLDLAVSRTLVWGLLTAGVVAAYVTAVAVLTPLLSGDRAPEVLATALVAAGFQPARAWLQRRVERLVRGESANPMRAVRRVGRRLHAPGDDMLAGVAESIASSLRLGSAAIEATGPAGGPGVPGLDGTDGTDADGRAGSRVLAQVGEPAGEEVTVPLAYPGGEGRLIVTARPGERLDRRTRASLHDLGPIVATTTQLALATEALQASRRRLAEARDEERRSLRRELHDGLGPALAGLGLGLQAVRNRLTSDPDGAADLLDRITSELEDRVEEVRGLARGLLPPVLGEMGLGAALDELAERYAVTGLDVDLAVEPAALPHIEPEVANAVYAIVSEAVRNVARHAAATRCRVGVGLDDDLVVAVSDDGVGITAGAVLGVGLVSMRERAEGLGGTLRVVSGTGSGDEGPDGSDGRALIGGLPASGGTTVEVRLPMVARS